MIYINFRIFNLNGNFEIKINGFGKRSGSTCRHRSNVIKRDDGVLIFRYRLFEECNNFVINVLYNGNHVSGSPYKTKEIIPESCYCPTFLSKWEIECPEVADSQIDNDLIPFKSINFTHIRPKFLEKFNNPDSTSFCNYVLKDNRVYRRCYGKYTGFSMFMDAVLLSLTRIAILPDLEMFINLGDWPLVKKGGHSRTILFPVFSWCGSDDSFDIVLPTYDITEATLENMGRVSLDMLSVQRSKVPWVDKIPKAFWRGRDSRKERLDLIDISRKRPDLFNVSMTNFFFYHDKAEQYGPTEKHISFHDFFDYRYQINIDGTVAAYRLPYLLVGDGVVLKQDSTYYEYFYKKLKPMEHYIPIKHDLSDLIERIEWARLNDLVAHKIGRKGREFAEENLMPLNIICNHLEIFRKYAKNLVSPVKVLPGMEEVPQPDTAKCRCPKRPRVNREEHDEL